jgi:phosphoribosyl 1,2-cyclic phosphate phosphodiesterase
MIFINGGKHRLRIEILGSGGASIIPRPFCTCRVCVEAREKGVPYSRGGPCYFIHDINLLIDSPEDIGGLLVRSAIERVDHLLYSHWHPDHTMGIRFVESNYTPWQWPPHPHNTQVYLPQQVAEDFKRYLGLAEQMAYFSERGYITPHYLTDGQTLSIADITIQPFRVAEAYVYAFLFSQNGKHILIAPDELYQWSPPDWLPPLELAILPAGLMEFNPFTDERIIPSDHPVLGHEATFVQTLEMVRQLKAKQTILGHLAEPDGLSYDDHTRLAQRLAQKQAELGVVSFAFDQQIIEI